MLKIKQNTMVVESKEKVTVFTDGDKKFVLPNNFIKIKDESGKTVIRLIGSRKNILMY